MLYLVGGLAYKGISQNSLQICVFQLGLTDTIDSIYIHTHVYSIYKINKVLLYSTRNYIQNPIINHNGKENEKRVCVYN